MSRNAGTLKPYAFSFIHDRDNQMPFRGLLVNFTFIYRHLPMFPTLPEGNVEYYILFENRIVDSKKCYRKK